MEHCSTPLQMTKEKHMNKYSEELKDMIMMALQDCFDDCCVEELDDTFLTSDLEDTEEELELNLFYDNADVKQPPIWQTAVDSVCKCFANVDDYPLESPVILAQSIFTEAIDVSFEVIEEYTRETFKTVVVDSND